MEKLSNEKLWSDILSLVEKYAKLNYGPKFNVNVFCIASVLRDSLEEYTEQSALNTILDKCKKEALTNKEESFLRERIIRMFNENSRFKSGLDSILLRPVQRNS